MDSIGVTVVSRYIDFLIILLILIPLVLVLFCSSIPTSSSFKCCFVLVYFIFVQYSKRCSRTFEIVQKSRSREHGDISISRARVPRLPRAKYRVTFQDEIMVS